MKRKENQLFSTEHERALGTGDCTCGQHVRFKTGTMMVFILRMTILCQQNDFAPKRWSRNPIPRFPEQWEDEGPGATVNSPAFSLSRFLHIFLHPLSVTT